MELQVLDTVVLTRELSEHGLRAGDLGTVVELHAPDGLEVEFVLASGYLAHRQDVDAYLSAQREDFESKRAAALAADPMFYQKLAASRRTRLAS